MRKLINLLRRIVCREQWHPLFTYPLFLIRVQLIKYRYKRTLRKCQRKFSCDQPIRVLFLVANCSKWKAQSLYELMLKDKRFDPILGITLCDDEVEFEDNKIQQRIDNDINFYNKIGNKWLLLCDVATRRVVSPQEVGADIVFFPTPWGLCGDQRVSKVSKYALTCYIPYAIDWEMYQRTGLRFGFYNMANFHLLMWAQFFISDLYANYIKKAHFGFERSGKMLGLGHTAFDPYLLKPSVDEHYVIFAPHFAFTYNGHLSSEHSTFKWSGRFMLEYAKAHPKLNWVFKPHPVLRNRLSEIGYMSKDEVDKYYKEWEKIGVACYDGGYDEFFRNSRALITDCGSFQIEYAVTGKPLIRLVSPTTKLHAFPLFEKLLKSYYRCEDENSLKQTLDLVLLRELDPKRDLRISAAKDLGLLGNFAAKNIMEMLCSAFS